MEANLGYKMCDNRSRCYHPSLLCDGLSQCEDKSDEVDCMCPITSRSQEERFPQIHTDYFLHNYDRKEATFPCRGNDNETDICAIR